MNRKEEIRSLLEKSQGDKKISEGSLKAYTSTINTFLTKNNLEIKDLNNIDKVKELTKDRTKTYQKTLFSAIIRLIDDEELIKTYKSEIGSKMEKIIDEQKEGKLNKKEKKLLKKEGEDKLLSNKDLTKIITKIKKDIKKYTKDNNSREEYITKQYLLLSTLLLKLNILPRNDYANMLVVNSKDKVNNDHNWLIVTSLTDMKMIFKKFKNVAKLGEIEIKIPKSIAKVIADWLRYREYEEQDNFWLLFNKFRNTHYNTSRFTELVQRMFSRYLEKPLSMNQLRKIRENDIISNPKYQKANLKQKERIHKKLFHSKGIAELYYHKK